MTIPELMQIIDAEELDPPIIYGNSENRQNAVVLERGDKEWQVHITDERGSIMEKTQSVFDTESAALEYVLLKLRQTQQANRSLASLFKKKRKPSKPTHIRQVNNNLRDAFRDNMRPYPETIRSTLNTMNGTSFWSFALWAAPKGTDFSNDIPPSNVYMKCIGSAKSMMIEISHPDPDDPSVVYRLIVGKPGDYSGEPGETLSWGDGHQSTKVYPSELFSADEAAAIVYGYFDATAVAKYYRFRNASVTEGVGATADAYEIESVEEMERQQLNAAIVAYIGDGSFPHRDQAAVKELAAGGEEALTLIAKVMEIVDGSLSVEIDWSTHTLTQAGDEVKRVMSARYPGLNEKALDKLAWTFMYSNR